MIEVIALIQMPEDREFQHQAERERDDEREQQRGDETAGHGVEHHGEIGAEHVLHAVREVDEIHHPEHQRQPRRDQKQQDAELQPVEKLNDKERKGHIGSCAITRKDPPLAGGLSMGDGPALARHPARLGAMRLAPSG